MKRVVVGLSGGVDSSVAAYLLKEQGYEVIAMFMKNWHDDSVILDDDCPWIEDSADALIVAEKLGIPFQTIDLSKEYKKRIVDYMFNEYAAGRTPNPDVLCNREIKFDIFLKAAMKLKADYVATGHYCRKSEQELEGEKVYSLLSGLDNGKDQSYFLCQINQYQLSKALFPIGHMQKAEVRKIAKDLDLVTADKKDSQGLCFVGKISLPDFLQQQLKPKKGKIIEISAASEIYENISESDKSDNPHILSRTFDYSPEDGEIVGEHNGAHYFTIGQRKGLNVGGKAKPLFVIDTDVEKNITYTGQGDDHPGLYRYGLFIPNSEIHWLRKDLEMKNGEKSEYLCRIRYRQALQKATLFKEENGLYIIFKKKQRGITPGQFAAWYEGEELLGSGVIA